MTNHIITTKMITSNDFVKLIEFDTKYIYDAMKKIDIPFQQLPPALTPLELEEALSRQDILEWIFFNDDLAGYFWLEKKPDCIYIGGIAIREEFHGKGLLQYILERAEQIAHENKLLICKLAVIPLNGRAVNAYFKSGYKITECILSFFGMQHPESFRFIMKKNLSNNKISDSFGEYTIKCTDYTELKNATDKGDIGVRLIRSVNKNNFENIICFQKRG